MSSRDEAVRCLKNGYTLLEIATELKISVSSVVQYLYTTVGEGKIRRSDILFSISQEERNIVETLIGEDRDPDLRELLNTVKRNGSKINVDILKIYFDLRDARVQMGDMYEYISKLEKNLHLTIKQVLINKYGSREDGWWRQGIPVSIRKTCAALREEDPEPAEEPYCYTNFIDLKEILDKQWNIFSHVLPKESIEDKRGFLSNFTRLNRIRNCVMHPVKSLPPTESDFEFVRNLNEQLEAEKWRRLDELFGEQK